MKVRVLIVGGGICGISCLQHLFSLIELYPNQDAEFEISVITPSSTVKQVVNYERQEDSYVEKFDVEVVNTESLRSSYPSIKVIEGNVLEIDLEKRCVKVSILCEKNNVHEVLPYDKIVLATGGVPRPFFVSNSQVVQLRDFESITNFLKKLDRSKKIMVVGNGGIALSLIAEFEVCDELVWVVKDEYVGNTFLDASASSFFLESQAEFSVQVLERSNISSTDSSHSIGKKRLHHSPNVTNKAPRLSRIGDKSSVYGSALGPGWTDLLSSSEPLEAPSRRRTKIHLEKCTSVSSVLEVSFPSPTTLQSLKLEVALENGAQYVVDYIVNATGVLANLPAFKESSNRVRIDQDSNGLCVDAEMRLLSEDLSKCFAGAYAAGDCCSISSQLWDNVSASDVQVPLWFQMRLWSQARAQGVYVADCVFQHASDDVKMSLHRTNRTTTALASRNTLDVASASCFDVFVHSTRIFRRPCLLLGLYNGQGLGQKYEDALKRSVMYSSQQSGPEIPGTDTMDGTAHSEKDVEVQLRIVPNEQYVKLVLYQGRMVGAILIGDTGLDETVENLITNRLSLRVVHGSDQSINILDPTVDIEDYFD
jgi:pyridine nucleotide-disulfide oxidoreductase domain-containing protein 1